MERFKKIIKCALHPNMALILLLTILSAAALIFTFVTNREETVIGYISFVLSAYAMTVIIVNGSDMVLMTRTSKFNNRIQSLIYSNKYGNRYMTDIPYRAKISLYSGLIINLLYAALKMTSGIYYASFWYGADAIFYTVLSAAQFLLLRHIRKNEKNLVIEYKQYRFCGILLFALNAALTGVVFQILHQNMGYQYPGLMIYAAATYAFACLITAIINVVKYQKLNSPVLSAVKYIRLARVLVAMYALQTAMLTSFGGDDENLKNIFNNISGGAVCVIIFGMAVFMVIRANNNLKKLRINNLET